MLTVILDMKFTSEGFEEFLVMAAAGLKETREINGFISVVTLQDEEDPRNITLYEQWRCRENFDDYLAWRESQGLLEALNTLSSTPPVWRYFDTLDI